MLGGIVAQLRHPRQSSCLALASLTLHSTTTFDRLRKLFNKSGTARFTIECVHRRLQTLALKVCFARMYRQKNALLDVMKKRSQNCGQPVAGVRYVLEKMFFLMWVDVEAKKHMFPFCKCACWRLVLHNGQNSTRVGHRKKVTSNRQSFKSVTGICLLIDGGSFVLFWRRFAPARCASFTSQ